MALNKLNLPYSLTSPTDLNRIIRELDSLDDFLLQLQLRKQNGQTKLPKTSYLLEQLLQQIKVNILIEEERHNLINYLKQIKSQAPLIHISFAADPSPLFLSKIIIWLRQNIHPYLLITTGLQPNIGAGCMIRTTNRFIDLSLKKDFNEKKQLLLNSIKEISKNNH